MCEKSLAIAAGKSVQFSVSCLPPAFPFPGRSWSRKVIIILAVPRAYSQPSRDISWDAELRNWVLQKSFAEIAEWLLQNWTILHIFTVAADKRTKRNFQLSGQIWKDSIWPNHSGHVSYHKAGKTWLDKYIYPLAFNGMWGRMLGRYSIHSQWTRILFLFIGGKMGSYFHEDRESFKFN